MKNEEKTVKIRLPLTRDDNSDVHITVNNRSWLIKRGETVEVPECAAEVLRNQEEMLKTAYEFENANSN